MSDRVPWFAAPAEDVMARWNEWAKMIRELPPRPSCFMAHHLVPYGQVFRQWTARGDLIVWVNRGEIEDLPRRRPKPYAIAPNGIDTEMLTSIPVVVCEAANSHPEPPKPA